MKYFIYRIYNDDPTLGSYIGSTCNIQNRVRSHRHNCHKNPNSLPAYSVINANGGFKNWKTEVIEEIETENKRDALDREQHWIDNTEKILNNKTGKTSDMTAYMAKWYEKNRLNVLSYKKDYYKENREKRLAYQKQYYDKKKSNVIVKNDCATNEIPSQD